MNIGDCFWQATWPSYAEHLWVVIAAHEGKALIVNFSTLRNQPDPSCVVKAGEHPNITKDSVVLYHYAREADPELIRSNIANGRLKPGVPFSGDLLLRILAGALKSKSLRAKFKSWVKIPA
jgi:hypothetical protein